MFSPRIADSACTGFGTGKSGFENHATILREILTNFVFFSTFSNTGVGCPRFSVSTKRKNHMKTKIFAAAAICLCSLAVFGEVDITALGRSEFTPTVTRVSGTVRKTTEDVNHAFDGNTGKDGRVMFSSSTGVIQYDIPDDYQSGAEFTLTSYKLMRTHEDDSYDLPRAPTQFKLEAFDGSDWVTLHEKTADDPEDTWSSTVQEITYEIPAANRIDSRSYRFSIYANNGSTHEACLSLNDLTFYGDIVGGIQIIEEAALVTECGTEKELYFEDRKLTDVQDLAMTCKQGFGGSQDERDYRWSLPRVQSGTFADSGLYLLSNDGTTLTVEFHGRTYGNSYDGVGNGFLLQLTQEGDDIYGQVMWAAGFTGANTLGYDVTWESKKGKITDYYNTTALYHSYGRNLRLYFSDAASQDRTVYFKGKEGETIKTYVVPAGEYAAVAPTAAEMPDYGSNWIFLGWDKPFDNVQKLEFVVNALYHKLCTVTFMGGVDGQTVLDEQTVEQTHAATAPEAPEIPNYVFLGWDVDFSDIEDDLVVTAVYDRTYQVVFKNPDDSVIDTQTVRTGSAAAAPDMAGVEYQGLPFFGWVGDFSCVTSDLEIAAYYGLRPDFAMHFTVTIPENYSQGSCTTYPVLVRMSETGIPGFDYDDFLLDGRDIYVEDASGNALPYELASWNTDGESLLYVQVTSELEGTDITVSYGGAMACESPEGMWEGYVGVWHFEEASGDAKDSTGHGLTATPHGVTGQMTASDDAFIGRSRVNASADGTTNGMGVSADINNYITTASAFTVEGWFKATNASGYTRVFSRKNSYSDVNGFEIEYNSGSKTSGKFTGAGGSPRVDFQTADTTAGWQKLTFVVNGDLVNVYTNGALSATGSISPVKAASVGFSIGNDADFNERQWWGIIDEVKFYDGAKSAARVAFEYAAETGAPLVCGAATANDTSKPCIATVSITSADGESMTVSLGLTTLGDGASSAEAYIAYGLDAGNLCEPVKFAEGDGSPLTGSVDGLTSEATYAYSIYVENDLGQVSDAKTGAFRVAATTFPVANELSRAGLLQGKINSANDFSTDILANSVIPLEVVPGVVMALYKVDSGKQDSVFYTSPYTGSVFKWNGSNTTFGYFGEIYLPVGELHIGKNIDDSAYVKIGDEVILNNTTYNAYPVATLNVEKAGWYPIEVRIGDGDGGKGITDESKFNGNGIAYNIDGTTDPAKADWAPLMDADGGFLRYVSGDGSYLGVGLVAAAADGTVTAWLSVDGEVPSASKLVAFYGASDGGENADGWSGCIVLAELARGESLVSTKFTIPDLAKYGAVRFALVCEASETSPALSQFSALYEYEQILPIVSLKVGEIEEEGVSVTMPVAALGAGADSATLRLEYSLTSDFAESGFITVGTCTEARTFDFDITTLDPATTYFVRAVLENSEGETGVSDAVQFTTFNSAVAHVGDRLVWAGGSAGTWDNLTENWLSPKNYMVAWLDGCTAVFANDAEIEVFGAKSVAGIETGADVTLSGDAVAFDGATAIVYNDNGTLRFENDVSAAAGLEFNLREQVDDIRPYEIEGNISDEDQLLFTNVKLSEMDTIVATLHCQFGGASGEYTINSALPNKNTGGKTGDNGIFYFVRTDDEWTCQFQGVIYSALCINCVKVRLHQVGDDVWGYRVYKRSAYARSAELFGSDFDTNGVGDGYDEWLFNLELRKTDALPTECRTEFAGAYASHGVETKVNAGVLAFCGEQVLDCRLRAQNGGSVEFAEGSEVTIPAANSVVFNGSPFHVYGTMTVGAGSGNYGLFGGAKDAFRICDGGRLICPSIYDPYGYNGSKFTVLPGGVLETVGNFGIGCNGNDVVLQGGEWLQSYEYASDSGKYVVLKSVTLSDGAVISGGIGSMGYDYYNSDYTVKVQGTEPCAIALDELCLGTKNKKVNSGSSGSGCKSIFNVDDVTGDPDSDLVVSSDISGAAGMTVEAGGEAYYFLRKKGAGTLELTGEASSAPLCQFQFEAGTVKMPEGASAEFGTFALTGDATLDITEGGSLSFADSSAISWTADKTLEIVGKIDFRSLRFGTDENGLTEEQLGAIVYNGKKNRVFLNPNGYLRSHDFTSLILK